MLPNSRRAMMLTAISHIEEREIPMPEYGSDDVVIKIKAIGICGSDLVYFSKGGSTFAQIQYPHILGHEAAGIVVAIGSNVKNIQIGDRVAIEPGVPCGECDLCRSGKYNLCKEVSFMSTPIYRKYSEGAFTEYSVRPATFVYKLPDNVSFEEGAMVEPLSVGMQAVERSGATLGEKALVLGCGPISLCVILSLRAHGIKEIFAIDIVSNRCTFAESLGTKRTFDCMNDEIIQEILGLTDGHGIDIIFDTTDSAELINASMAVLAKDGRIVMIGVPHEDCILINYRELFMRQATLITSFRYMNQYPKVIRCISEGSIPIRRIITHRFDFCDTQKAFEKCLSRENSSDTIEKAVVFIE